MFMMTPPLLRYFWFHSIYSLAASCSLRFAVCGLRSAVCSLQIGIFSITFFMGNCKPQTAKCHVTTALRSRLQFAVYFWTAGRASKGKSFTARFFATRNCTASRLKVWTSFLYPFAMCLLDFWSRINELLKSFGRLNCLRADVSYFLCCTRK